MAGLFAAFPFTPSLCRMRSNAWHASPIHPGGPEIPDSPAEAGAPSPLVLEETRKEETPSLTGGAKRKIVVLKVCLGGIEWIQREGCGVVGGGTGGWRRNTFLRCHISHLQHRPSSSRLSSALEPQQLQPLRLWRRNERLTIRNQRAHQMSTSHFLLHAPSAQGKVLLQTRIFNATLRCTTILPSRQLSGLKYAFQTYFIYI